MHDEKSMPLCPFCALEPSRIVGSNPLAAAILDRFPIPPGHTLIIPRRHIASLFEATEEERAALFSLLGEARELLLKERTPDGFNIGINDGVAAGQTVMRDLVGGGLALPLTPTAFDSCTGAVVGAFKI